MSDHIGDENKKVETQPLAYHWKDICRDTNGPDICDEPCSRCATPSSAGTVSVEAAIKAGAGMIVKRRDNEYRVGDQGFNRYEDALEYAALRALAGEGGR